MTDISDVQFILYLLFILVALFSVGASFFVNTTFRRYNRRSSSYGRTAADVARSILSAEGITNVHIERIGGNLTDHYDPRTRVLRLSEGVYSSSSPAAIGVAAHEAGHAIQDAKRYAPLKLRQVLAPITTFSSRFSWVLIIIGVILDIILGFETESSPAFGYYLIIAGIGLFGVTTVFSLITLPVEFNASGRAMRQLRALGFPRSDLAAARKVLTAAALTYVAAFASSLIQLLRLILIFGRRRK